MAVAGFRSRIRDASNFTEDRVELGRLPSRPRGYAPAPFDALDSLRLSGPRSSHPLALVELPSLLGGPTDGLEGKIEIDGAVLVGEQISGRIHVRAKRRIRARSASLRLVGVHLAEHIRSEAESTSEATTASAARAEDPAPSRAHATDSVSWVEVHGSTIESLPFTEPMLPTVLEPGQVVDLPFTIPAPRLGPPTAHAGVAAIAWAIEAHWDVAMATDERVCGYVHVGQHPDLLRAGVLTLPSGALNDVVIDEDASIAIEPYGPVPAGTPLQVTVAWPGAPSARSARLELWLEVRGDSRLDLNLASVSIDRQDLGQTTVLAPLDLDLPPTLQVPDLDVGYRLRVTVDRKLRTDVRRERAIVVY
jgi:hypothetical protein